PEPGRRRWRWGRAVFRRRPAAQPAAPEPARRPVRRLGWPVACRRLTGATGGWPLGRPGDIRPVGGGAPAVLAGGERQPERHTPPSRTRRPGPGTTAAGTGP